MRRQTEHGLENPFMRIKLTSLMVDDQSKALKFYTDILGLSKETRNSRR
jgi:catechol 2,3-dioxygenase-like lactoylglutathione lyase family enzyme